MSLCKEKYRRSKEVKTSTDLRQGRQIWREKKKKGTTYAKPWEGPALFSLPENRRTVKKVNQRFFKDGGGGKAKKRP